MTPPGVPPLAPSAVPATVPLPADAPAVADAPAPARRGRSWSLIAVVWAARLVTVGLIAGGLYLEAKTSFFQSYVVTRLIGHPSFSVAAGPNPELRFPASGP